MAGLKEYLDRVAKPISPTSIFGDEIPRNQEDYQAVRKKIMYFTPGMAKAAGDINENAVWEEILDHCVVLLEKISKDIQIMCFFTAALYNRFGPQGLNKGLEYFNNIIESSFDSLFPKRSKLQANAFNWFGEYFQYSLATKGSQLSENPRNISVEEAKEWVALPDNLESLVSIVNEKIDMETELDKKFIELPELVADYKDLFKDIICPPKSDSQKETSMAKLSEDTEKTKNTNVSSSGQKQSASEKSQLTAPRKAEISPELSLEFKTKKEAVKTLFNLTQNLLVLNPSDPLPYILDRKLIWADIIKTPPRPANKTEAKETVLPCPPDVSSVKLIMKNKSEGQQFDSHKLILQFEKMFGNPGMAFWLDLHYFLWHLAGELSWFDVQKTIFAELYQFVKRMDHKITESSFANGTPFASSDVLQWLEKTHEDNIKIPVESAISQRSIPSQSNASVSLIPERIQHDYLARFDDEKLSIEELLDELKTANHILSRWQLSIRCAKALLQKPDKQVQALSILESCRWLAEKYTLKEIFHNEYARLLMDIRHAEYFISGSKSNYNILKIEDDYLNYVNQVYWDDPVRFFRLEFGV
ncbi:type VI secretion system domain-containing protein [bacterium]|nr:type VI secretion system domain-containing protein [candidate division CSSED10-310 bacterium]